MSWSKICLVNDILIVIKVHLHDAIKAEAISERHGCGQLAKSP
jgi:hypothetical protein